MVVETGSPVALKTARKAPRRVRRWLLEGVIVIAALAGLQAWLTRDVVRGPLPAIKGVLLDGSFAESWLAARRGQAHAIYVWGTWCSICSAMQGNLDAVARSAPILTVAQRSGTVPEVARYLATHGLNWTTLNDPAAAVSQQLGVSAVPMLLFVSPRGEVQSVTRGYTTEFGIRVRLWWAARSG